MGNILTKWCLSPQHNYSKIYVREFDEASERMDGLHNKMLQLSDEFESNKRFVDKRELKRINQLSASSDLKCQEMGTRINSNIDETYTLKLRIEELEKSILKVNSIKKKFDTLGTMLLSRSENEFDSPSNNEQQPETGEIQENSENPFGIISE